MPAADIPPNNNSKGDNNPRDDREYDLLANESEPIPPMEEDGEWVTVDFPNAIGVDSIPVSDEITAEELTPKILPEIAPEIAPEIPSKIPPKIAQKQIEGKSFIIQRSPQEEPDAKKADSTTKETEETTTIIKALHECNRDLVNRVTELESNLESCREKLQSSEFLLKEKTEELTAAQKQVSHLFYKLEVCNEIIQRQEVLAETLRENWEKSQARQGQLERECALTQQRFNDACYRAMELENNCRELRSRLYRQQRQTLQFKVALEKALEMPENSDRGNLLEATAAAANEEAKGSILVHPTANKIVPATPTAPVKPWSAQLHKETPQAKQSDKSINLEKETSSASTSQGETGEVTPESLPIESQQTVLQYMARAAGGFPEELIDEEKLSGFYPEATVETPGVENEMPTIPKSDRISWNLATGEWNTDKSVGGGDGGVELPEAIKTEIPAAAAWPPPTIHHKRSRKKRQSLAAIDLPTFPRSETPSAVNG